MIRIKAFIILAIAAVSISSQGTTGSVSGRVLDAVSGVAVAGATMQTGAGGNVTTDAEGYYTLRGLPPGHHRIWVREANGGYVAMTLTVPRNVLVTAGHATTGVDFRVRLDAQISGRVFDDNGKALSGIRVVVLNREYSRDGYTPRPYSNGKLWYSAAASTITDETGRYSVRSGLFGSRMYWVLAYAASKPGEKALVATYFPNAASLNNAIPVVLRSLESRDNVDVHMSRSVSYCFDATLTSGGRPVKARFAVVEDEIFQSLLQSSGLFPRAGVTGADGKLRVCGLYPGAFQVATFSADSLVPGGFPLTIPDHDVKDVRIPVLPPVDVSGEVVWDSTPAKAVTPITLKIGTLFSNTVAPSGATTPVPGEFSLRGMPPADYSLSIFGLSEPLYVKDIQYGGSSILHKSFAPDHSGSSKLRIIVGRDGGTILSRVTDTDGRAISNALVLILPAEALTEAELATTIMAELTNENGICSSETLPQGRYDVIATMDLPAGRMLLPMGTFNLEKTPETLRMLLDARTRGQRITLGSNTTVQLNLVPITLQ